MKYITTYENFEYFIYNPNDELRKVTKDEFLKYSFIKDRNFSIDIDNKKIIGNKNVLYKKYLEK